MRAFRERHEDDVLSCNSFGEEGQKISGHRTVEPKLIRTECEKILKWVQLLNEETKDPESWTTINFHPRAKYLLSEVHFP